MGIGGQDPDGPEGVLAIDLVLDTSTQGTWEVLDVRGEVDAYTAPRLRERILELVNAGKYRIVANLEGVEFMDSTGLGVLVGGLKRVREHDGTLALVCTKPAVLRVLAITGLNEVFPLHQTVDEAVAS